MTVMISTNDAPGFRAGDRHGRQALLCGYLEQIILGQRAAELLDQAETIPQKAALAQLPCWTWLPASAKVRRKGVTRDGDGVLLLPARTIYDAGPLIITDQTEHPIHWSYAGPGASGSGPSTVRSTDRTVISLTESLHDGELPATVEAERMPRRAIIKRLTTLVAEGKAARWSMLAELERLVRQSVEQAHNAVVADLNDIDFDTWSVSTKLDDAHLEALITRIAFGDENIDLDDSHLSKVITKLTQPGTLAKVDIMRWLRVNLYRDAVSEIRKELGDPHIGTKVRKLARSMPGATQAEILLAYRNLYPADKAGADRIVTALNPVGTSQIHHTDTAEQITALTVPDHADDVIDSVDLAARVHRAVIRPAPINPPRIIPAPASAITRPGVADPFDKVALVQPRERQCVG
jgi:hypothetical protein